MNMNDALLGSLIFGKGGLNATEFVIYSTTYTII